MRASPATCTGQTPEFLGRTHHMMAAKHLATRAAPAASSTRAAACACRPRRPAIRREKAYVSVLPLALLVRKIHVLQSDGDMLTVGSKSSAWSSKNVPMPCWSHVEACLCSKIEASRCGDATSASSTSSIGSRSRGALSRSSPIGATTVDQVFFFNSDTRAEKCVKGWGGLKPPRPLAMHL